MAKRVAEDPFYYCVDAIFMMVSVPNNLNIQFSTCHTNEFKTKEHIYTHTHLTLLPIRTTPIQAAAAAAVAAQFAM